MKAPKKIAAVVAAAAASIAMTSGAAHAQDAPAAPAPAPGSINTESLAGNPVGNAALISVGGPAIITFFVLCDMSVSFGNAPAGSCS